MKVDTSHSFKDLNPIMCTSIGIKNLYESEGKKKADKIMWSIFLLDFPDKDINPKAGIPYEERLLDIRQGYYDLDLAVEGVKTARADFGRYCLTFEENMYRIQKGKLDELTAYFEQLDLDASDDDFDKYIKISDKLGKIWLNFDKVKKDYLTNKDTDTHTFGNSTLSKAESRRIKR